MRTRAAVALLAALVAACATPYREPDPAASPTARIRVHNPNADDPLVGTANTILDVYESDRPCDPSAGDLDDAFRGTLDLDQVDQDIRVVAGHEVFFQLAYAEGEYDPSMRRAYDVSCRGVFGFLPQAGEDYALEIHVSRHGRCDATLTRLGEEVETLELLHPSACFAGGW